MKIGRYSNIVKCTLEHIRFLAANSDESSIDWVAEYEKNPTMAFTLIADGVPVVAGGYFLVAPGTWRSWMIGSVDGWQKHWRSITRAALRMMQAMFEVGAKRLETCAPITRVKACRWYEKSLHMMLESVHDGVATFVRTA